MPSERSLEQRLLFTIDLASPASLQSDYLHELSNGMDSQAAE